MTVGRDLVHALRVAAKRPGFSLAVVLTLALGIGANTAVFSFINTVILRPLPYTDPDRLYTLFEQDSLGASRQLVSYPTFLDWHEQSDVFDGFAYIRGAGLTYQTEDQSGILLGAFVSEEFFPALRVPARLGRALLPDDYLPGNGNGNVAVLSHRVWRSSFGGDTGVIGRTAILRNNSFTVVGVVGDVKHFGLDAEPQPVVYVPNTHNPWTSVALVARAAAQPEQLLAAIERAVRVMDPAIPLEGARLGLGAMTMEARVRRSYAPQRFNAALVSGFAIAALLLAAVGIYGVMSYTVALETREIGIRIALGAAPPGVMRAVVGRVLRVTIAGLIAGVAAALGLTRLMTGLLYQVEPTDPVAG